MKLITLNTWGGRLYQPLIEFIAQYAESTDIFCLQEVWHTTEPIDHSQWKDRLTLFTDISEALPGFTGYFDSAQDNYIADHGFVDFPLSFGQAIFVKQSISVKDHGDIFVYGHRNARDNVTFMVNPKNLQYIRFEEQGTITTVANFHGLWQPGTAKADLPERLEQSKKVREFLDNGPGKKILCGDFNLLPTTESYKILKDGYTDLIERYNITSTRSHLYEKPVKFADYILVSPEITVKDFQVLPDVVSDHLALQLDWE